MFYSLKKLEKLGYLFVAISIISTTIEVCNFYITLKNNNKVDTLQRVIKKSN